MARDKTPLPADDLQKFLGGHPGWALDGGQLRRTLEFPAFLAGISFVQQIAAVAEREDHHPDLDIRWRKVTVQLFTHDAKALTWRDLRLATEVDVLADKLGGR